MNIHRPDLAEATLRLLKSVDEDNCLTVLSQTWINVSRSAHSAQTCQPRGSPGITFFVVQIYKSGMQSNLDEIISQLNQLSERVGGYSLKTYNLLGCTLMLKNDIDRAIKIFETAVNELQLETEEGQRSYLSGSNPDLSCLIFNYIKCLAIRNGQGQGFDFFKTDPTSKLLFGYLARIDPAIGRQFFEERQRAETLFDSAVAQL
jgi:hypothetical protein